MPFIIIIIMCLYHGVNVCILYYGECHFIQETKEPELKRIVPLDRASQIIYPGLIETLKLNIIHFSVPFFTSNPGRLLYCHNSRQSHQKRSACSNAGKKRVMIFLTQDTRCGLLVSNQTQALPKSLLELSTCKPKQLHNSRIQPSSG